MPRPSSRIMQGRAGTVTVIRAGTVTVILSIITLPGLFRSMPRYGASGTGMIMSRISHQNLRRIPMS